MAGEPMGFDVVKRGAVLSPPGGDDVSWRIVLVRPAENAVSGVQIAPGRFTQPVWMDLERVLDAVGRGDLVPADDPATVNRSSLRVTAGDRRTWQRRWRILEPLVTNGREADILDPKQRARLVRQRARETGTRPNRIYRLLAQWFRGGMTPEALRSNYDRCGRVKRAVSAKGPKRGRPSDARRRGLRSASDDGLNITPEIAALLRRGADRFLLGRKDVRSASDLVPKRRSLRAAYRLTLATYFTTGEVRLIDSVPECVLLPPGERPSLRQFVYHGVNSRTFTEVLERRAGTTRVRLRHRAALGSPGLAVQSPGAVYQIDSTVLDVYVRSRWQPQRVLGRPCLYVVRDWATTAVVGLHLSLSAPSYENLAGALLNAAEDKAEFCSRYGIRIDRDEWPARGVCASVLLDRPAENLGLQTDRWPATLDIAVANLPPHAADWKGLVERTFRTLNEEGLAALPGFVYDRERGEPSYIADAALTLDDLARILIVLILRYNERLVRPGRLDPALLASGESAVTRNEFWEWAIAHRGGVLREFPREELARRLLPRKTVSVTPRGISVNGFRYICPALGVSGAFLRNTGRASPTVEIAQDPRRVGTAWIVTPDGREWTPCVPHAEWQVYADLSLPEFREQRQIESDAARMDDERQLRADLRADSAIESIVTSATHLRDSARDNAPLVVDNLRANRAAESQRDREGPLQAGDDTAPQLLASGESHTELPVWRRAVLDVFEKPTE
jgi:hypothetical protein